MTETYKKLSGLIEAQHAFLDKYTTKDADGSVKSYDLDADQLLEFKKREAEINELAPKWEAEKETMAAQKRHSEFMKAHTATGGGAAGVPTEEVKTHQQLYGCAQNVKTLGEIFGDVLDEIIKAGKIGPIVDGKIDIRDKMRFVLPDAMKTVMTRATTYAPFVPRIDRMELTPTRRLTMADIIPSVSTNDSAIKYMQETTFTNNAAAVSENAQKPKSLLGYTEVTVLVETIAHLFQVTKQQLEDVAGFKALLENRGRLMLLLSEETELLTGSGTTPHLAGFLNLSGILTQAKGADPTPDAIFKGFQKIRGSNNEGFAEPDAVVMHPNDWTDIRLLRTADGQYIWGNPSEAGPERIWGKNVVQTPAMTENTALTGDFSLYSEIRRKGEVEVEFRDTNNDDFEYNRWTARIEERLALLIYRAKAFCLVTGI